MYNKVILLFGLIAVVSAKDLIVGTDGGTKIFEQNITASPTIWRQDNNLTINATDDEVIKKIVITDNRPDKYGEAAIVEGGEGHNNVTIELKSPAVFRGYDFTIEVFTAPSNGQIPITKDTDVNKPGQKSEHGAEIVPSQSTKPVSTEANNNQPKNPAVLTKDLNTEQKRDNRDTNAQTTVHPSSSTTKPQETSTKSVNIDTKVTPVSEEKHDEAIHPVFGNVLPTGIRSTHDTPKFPLAPHVVSEETKGAHDVTPTTAKTVQEHGASDAKVTTVNPATKLPEVHTSALTSPSADVQKLDSKLSTPLPYISH